MLQQEHSKTRSSISDSNFLTPTKVSEQQKIYTQILFLTLIPYFEHMLPSHQFVL